MRVTPIAEVKDLESEEVIMCVRGTLTKIYPRKSGTNAKGEWSIQNLVVKDRTGESKVMVNNKDEIHKGWRGKEVVIEAHHGDRGYTGVYAFDDNYDNTRKIKVTPTGDIYLANEGNGNSNGGDGGGEHESEPPYSGERRQQSRAPQGGGGGNKSGGGQQQQAPAKPPQPKQQQPYAGATLTKEELHAQGARAVLAAKKSGARNANLYCVAIDAVAKVVAPHFQKTMGVKMDAGQVQASVSAIYIAMQRESLDALMPVAPIDAPPVAKPEPAPPPPKPAPAPKQPEPDDDEIPF